MAAAARRSPIPPAGPLIAIGLLLALGVLAAAIRPPWQFDPIVIDLPRPTPRPPVLPQQSGVGTPSAAPMAPPADPPDLSWIRWVLLGLLITAVAVALALLAARLLAVRRMYADQPEKEVEILADVQPDLPTLRQGAARAEDRLLAFADPTDAIIAAWLAMEEAAHASGVDRRPAQTPSEFTAAVLGRTGVPAGPVQTLLELYLRARFAATPSTADDLERARRCIRELATGWSDFAGSRPADAGPGPGDQR